MFRTVISTIVGLSLSSVAQADLENWGGVIELDYGLLDVSDHEMLGFGGGIRYETETASHTFVFSARNLSRPSSPNPFGGLGTTLPNPDIKMFALDYRYGFKVSEKFEPYLKIGFGTADWGTSAMDALGNPVMIARDSSFFSLGAGILYRIHKDLHLKAEMNYMSFSNSALFSTPTSDAFGNPVSVVIGEPDLMFNIGLSMKF